jgi:Oxidoreductase molybdopterin binding domain
MKSIAGIIVMVLLAAAAGSARGDEVDKSANLSGLDGQQYTLTATALDEMPRLQVTLAEHGVTHVFEGAALENILARVGAPSGKAIHGKELVDVVLVEARDGYKVVIDLAATDPSFRKERVILADRMDGAPLPRERGPFQLVVEGDLRPARAVKMVSAIRLLRVQ